MHVTDIFLEELAKVGGEEIDEKTVQLFIQPFLKVNNSSISGKIRIQTYNNLSKWINLKVSS